MTGESFGVKHDKDKLKKKKNSVPEKETVKETEQVALLLLTLQSI